MGKHRHIFDSPQVSRSPLVRAGSFHLIDTQRFKKLVRDPSGTDVDHEISLDARGSKLKLQYLL
jgi:hypothetical protein